MALGVHRLGVSVQQMFSLAPVETTNKDACGVLRDIQEMPPSGKKSGWEWIVSPVPGSTLVTCVTAPSGTDMRISPPPVVAAHRINCAIHTPPEPQVCSAIVLTSPVSL